MVSIKNELVFKEMDTLVMIAKEAVESHQNLGTIHQRPMIRPLWP